MCFKQPKQSVAAATTVPAYVAPAQQQTSGAPVASSPTAAQPAPGVQVRGQSESRNSRTAVKSYRRNGGSGGQVDDTISPKRRRKTATSSLGL